MSNSYCLEFEPPHEHVKSAGLLADLSVIVSPSGTFTSLRKIQFLQNDESLSTLSHHTFYTPGDIRPWSEQFNISNFYYFIHSINPSADPINLVWQKGIPPQQGSTYGTRNCHHMNWGCSQRTCQGCLKDHNWVECHGFLNCTGEEMTGVWTGAGLGCSHQGGGTQITCKTEGNMINIGLGIGGVPVRRNFSFWTVARHRLRKYLSNWGL